MNFMSNRDRREYSTVREALCKAVRDSDDVNLKHFYHKIIKQIDAEIGTRDKLERAYYAAKKEGK
jgi:hypothetical protein